MNNREQRAHSAGLIEKAIPGCGRNIDTISQRTGLAGLTIRRVFDDTEYKFLLEKFEMEPFVSRIKTRQNKKIESLLEKISLCGGSYEVLSELAGYAPRSLGKLVNDKRYPELRKAMDDAIKDSKKKNYESSFVEIDNSKFLPHQIEFAYLRPDEVKHPAIVGGYGSGKTMSIPLRWLKLIDFRKEQNKKCELMVLEPSSEMIRDILVPVFDEFFDNLGIMTRYLSEKKDYTIFYKGEKHRCIFRSANRPRSLTGRNLTDVIIDEFDIVPYKKQKEIWRECISRIRRAEFGTCAVVTTPDGYKYTYELWVEGIRKQSNSK